MHFSSHRAQSRHGFAVICHMLERNSFVSINHTSFIRNLVRCVIRVELFIISIKSATITVALFIDAVFTFKLRKESRRPC